MGFNSSAENSTDYFYGMAKQSKSRFPEGMEPFFTMSFKLC